MGSAWNRSHPYFTNWIGSWLLVITPMWQILIGWCWCHTNANASPLLPYNYCSIPFRSAPALLLHPRLFLPPQEPKLLACASLAIFSYCPSVLRGSFTTSSLYLATVRSHCPSGLKGSFIHLLFLIACPVFSLKSSSEIWHILCFAESKQLLMLSIK